MDHIFREHIKQEWIQDMERLKVSIPFFLWLSTFASKQGLQAVYTQPSLQVQTSLSKIWHFTNGSSILAIHPPTDDLKILLKGEPILATPFRKGREGNDLVKLDDLKKVRQQVNCTNAILNTMANQLNHVALRIEETNKQTKIPLEGPSYANSISKPFFKTDSIPKVCEDALTKAWSNNHLLNQISDQIKALDAAAQTKLATCLDKTYHTKAIDSSSSDDEEAELSNSNTDCLNVLSEAFNDNPPPAINKIRHWNPSTSRNFYLRPSPPDLQYEERGSFSSATFDGNSVHT